MHISDCILCTRIGDSKKGEGIMQFMKGRTVILFMLLLTLLLVVCAYAKEGMRQTYVPYVQATKKVTATPVTHSRVTSIESMSQTKDTVCNQSSDAFIQQWVHLVRNAGATHMTIAVPYDNDCGQNSTAYALRWEQAARAEGLHIWWRQVFSEFEAIYGRSFVSQCNSPSQKMCNDYIALTKARIIAQQGMYQAGDVFSVTAETAASRIRGVNCFGTVCVFESANGSWNAIPEFNKFLVDGITAAKEAFAQIGLGSSVQVNAGHALTACSTIGRAVLQGKKACFL